MSIIVIKYNGTDITDDVVLRDAEFRSRTDASVGDATFRVLDRKDGAYTKDYFKAGNEVTLDVDGVRVWGGYIHTVSYDYPGAAWKVAPTTPRFFTIRCMDYNILFHRRVLWNKARPEYQMKQYKASGGPDSDKAIIRDMVNLYLDLSGDGFQSGGGDAIDLSNVIELGDIFWLENCSTTWQAASPGMKWGDGMRHIASWSGAVFYIGPANPSQTHKGPTLYYHDVNTKTGPYELNDRPASDPGSSGVQAFEYVEDITQMATEALVWGAGMGSDEMVFWRETASAAVAEYGTWQWGDFVTTMWLLECIQHRAKTYIHGSRQNKRGHKQPKKTWKATIFTPDFQVGDVVDMRSYVFDIQDNVPIREITTTFIGPTTPRFDLVLSHEMDTAYGTAMWWDPDDPARPDREGPGDDGGFGNRWYTQTIPLGIGPIITPGPENPSGDSRYTCYPGPEAVLIDKVRWWSDGTVQRLGPLFIPFDGNTEFGSYLDRLGNSGWPSCPCPGVGLGCWWMRSVSLQFIYRIHIPAGFDSTLYVLSERLRYQGQPGDFSASIITSEEEYQNFHNIGYDGDYSKIPVPGTPSSGSPLGGAGSYQPNNGMDGGFYDPSITGEPVVKVGNEDVMDGRLPPIQNGECAYYHWYSGCWGGYSSIPTFVISDPPTDQFIYLVFTPGWGVAPILDIMQAKCDTAYYPGGIAKGQGPAAEGLAGSGSYELPGRLDTIYCGDSGYDDTGPSPLDNTGVGFYQGPSDNVYYTHFPYVPGSLEVYVGGIPYHSFVEMDPATGQFSVHIGGIYSYGAFDIRYMASSPDPTEHGGMGEYNSEEGVNDSVTGDEGGPLGGAVLRPRFVSAFGWQTEFDGANVPFAQICHFIERTTQGTKIVTPPQVRSSSGIGHLGQISLANIRDILMLQGVGYWFPGTVSFETLKSGINEGRGAILVGDPMALGAFAPFTGLGTFDGPHALYINEIRHDGWMLVYDSAMRLPDDGVFYAPESVIKDYAASGANNRYGIANVIFTYRTQRV